MATIKYLLQSKLEASPIYLRLSISRFVSAKRKTGKFIDYRNWNYEKGMPKQNAAENKRLSADLAKLKTYIIEKLNDHTGAPITGDWLTAQIDSYYGIAAPTAESNLLIDHIQYIIDNAATRRMKGNRIGLSPNRVKSYGTFKNTILEYQTVINKKIDFIDIDQLFGIKFTDWLLKEKKYSINYAGKIIDNLKSVCQDAEKYKKKVDPGFKYIETFTEDADDRNIVTLSFDELDKIGSMDLKEVELINTRKWLLLGCAIGQRGEDLLNLRPDNIRERDGALLFDFKQKKTNKPMTIPINQRAKDVINTGFPYRISMKKFNERLKTLCLLAKINDPVKGKLTPKGGKRKIAGTYPKYELMASHVCRRSFATNYYNEGMSASNLMKVTGHTKESLFRLYIGVPEDKDFDAMQMSKLFETIENKKK